MTLQIYSNDNSGNLYIGTFFDINGQDYILRNTNTNTDKIVISDNANEINVRLEIFHNYENQCNRDHFKEESNTYYITNVIHNIDTKYMLFNDFLFNRTKAYYSQFPFSKNTKKWYNHGQLSYVIPEPKDPSLKNKIFIAPNKTYKSDTSRNLVYRKKIVDLLENNYFNCGYIGNYDDNPKLFLYPHIEFPWIDNIEDLENQKGTMHYSFWGYSPPHNEYYKNTFISIYGETIEHGSSIAVTEKTYDPLIKGHFVLPFSTSGFISHLKKIGFRFPNFIDYSYDNLIDNDLRYDAYQSEIKRLMSLDIDTWRQNWEENFDRVIRYNQLIFQEKPYDRIDFYKLLKGN